jgi:hypothetical protein
VLQTTLALDQRVEVDYIVRIRACVYSVCFVLCALHLQGGESCSRKVEVKYGRDDGLDQ